MAAPIRSRPTIGAVILASALLLASSPVDAARIPERAYVPAGRTSVIHIRVDSGCRGAATDSLEVAVPEELSNIVPEAIPGWTVETESAVGESPDAAGEAVLEPVALIRWSGGSLPDGQFMDFGFRAVFPDEPGRILTLPVVQRCGAVEVMYSGAEDGRSAPFVRIGEPFASQDVVTLIESVDELLVDVDQLQERSGDVRPLVLRERVIDVESKSGKLSERLGDLRERLRALEDFLLIEQEPGVNE